MLTITGAGWAKIELGEFSNYASYLTDIPNDILDAILNVFKTNSPQCVYFDGEGLDFYIVFTEYEIFVINELRKLTYIDINLSNSIYNEILNDIKSNIDDWSNWNPMPEDIPNEKIKLLNKITEIEGLI